MKNASKLNVYLINLSRKEKCAIMVSLDIVMFAACAVFVSWFLYGARFNGHSYFAVALAAVAATVGIAWALGLYGAIVRYIGLEFFHRANITVVVAAILAAFIALLAGANIEPIKWALMYWTLSVVYLCYSRYIPRGWLTQGIARADKENVIVYGAGSAGSQLIHCLLSGGSVLPVALIDDDPGLHGKTVNGIQVFPPADLDTLIQDYSVSRLLLAIPSASMRRRQEIVESLAEYACHIQTIPDFRHLVSGAARVDDIRDIELADLIGRPMVPPDPKLLHACIAGKTVLVTGAGGSIGSELCRQILRLDVKSLILLDISESSLYLIDKELRGIAAATSQNCEVVPLLGSVCDSHRVKDILASYDIQTIYHAAAYKHVPMVEHNLLEGVYNNSVGTFDLAKAACHAKVESFVLVSTDKAVRPTNVMGASKRLAELALQAYQETCKDTRFSMVRFGNVLESSGSVVPLFREQIRAGGPVTVTHPEIIRYFMTIQEAAELVIQAGSEAQGGDVFVLDMGEPVKIVDLARRMITLAGMSVRDAENPEGDIEITFTGLRPGEKLYEELLLGDNIFGTEHPRIMRAKESSIPIRQLQKIFDRLVLALDKNDCQEIREILLSTIPCYTPADDIHDFVWEKKQAGQPQLVLSNVTKIASHQKQVSVKAGQQNPPLEKQTDRHLDS